jgi:hypothetical protein
MVHWGSKDCNPPLPTDEVDAAWRMHLVEHAGVVGLSSVKHSNVEEWLWRMTFLQQTLSEDCGCLIWGDGPGKIKRMYLTIDVLRRWVGLWTNWSTLNRKEFVKLRVDRLTQECDGTLKEALRREAETAKPKELRAKA